MLGGHVAEELVFGEMTTGAHDDIGKVTQVARNMVTQWGMSDRLGPRTFGRRQSMVFLGRDISEERDYSERTAEEIDDEVRRVIDEAHERCRKVLAEHRDSLDKVASVLVVEETLEGDELRSLLGPTAGRTVPGDEGSTAVATPEPPSASGTAGKGSEEETEEERPQGRPGLAWGQTNASTE
jgi:cell division protease FtsH